MFLNPATWRCAGTFYKRNQYNYREFRTNSFCFQKLLILAPLGSNSNKNGKWYEMGLKIFGSNTTSTQIVSNCIKKYVKFCKSNSFLKIKNPYVKFRSCPLINQSPNAKNYIKLVFMNVKKSQYARTLRFLTSCLFSKFPGMQSLFSWDMKSRQKSKNGIISIVSHIANFLTSRHWDKPYHIVISIIHLN